VILKTICILPSVHYTSSTSSTTYLFNHRFILLFSINAWPTNDVINDKRNFHRQICVDSISPSTTSFTMTDKISINDRVYCIRGSYKGHYADVVKVMRMKVTIRLLANGKQPNVFRTSLRRVDKVRPKTFIGTARLGVFQILYDWVDSGKHIPIIGKGYNRYQLLEVTDLTNAIALAVSSPHELANDTFNVGAVRFDQVRKDVGDLCDFAGNGARVMPVPSKLVKPALAFFEFIHVSPLYKWVYGTADKDSYVSTDKITEKLGWNPKFSNSDALITSHKWYLEHKDELAHTRPGVTHRVGWNQGVLGFFKRFM